MVVPKSFPKGQYVAAVDEVYLIFPPSLQWDYVLKPTGFLTEYTPNPIITLQESRPLKELKRDESRVILTADYGVVMVVMDRQDYISKAQELIGD